MFQDFFKPSSKGSTESNPKYKPNTDVNGSGKKVKPVDNNNMTSDQGLNVEPLSNTSSATPHSSRNFRKETIHMKYRMRTK